MQYVHTVLGSFAARLFNANMLIGTLFAECYFKIGFGCKEYSQKRNMMQGELSGQLHPVTEKLLAKMHKLDKKRVEKYVC